MTGGGLSTVPWRYRHVGFIVQRKTADRAVEGYFEYVNRVSGHDVHSESFTSLVIAGSRAEMVKLSVEPGSSLSVTSTVKVQGVPLWVQTPENVVSGGGTLHSGNIQIHE